MSAGLVRPLGTIVIYHIDQSCCMYDEVMPSIMLTQRQLSSLPSPIDSGFLISAASVVVKADRRCTLPSLNTREPSSVSANTVPTPINAVAIPKIYWAARAIPELVSNAIASAVRPARKIKTLSAVTPRLVLRASYGLPSELYLCAQIQITARVTVSQWLASTWSSSGINGALMSCTRVV